MKILFAIFLCCISISLLGQEKKYEMPELPKTKCKKGYALFVGSGTSFSKNLDDNYKISFNLNLAFGFKLCNEWMLRFGYEYIRFDNKKQPEITYDQIGDINKITTNTYKAEILYGSFLRNEFLNWYISIGPGLYYTTSMKLISIKDASRTELNMGGSIGLGLSFQITEGSRIFIESQYDRIFNTGNFKEYVPIKLGYNYSFGD